MQHQEQGPGAGGEHQRAGKPQHEPALKITTAPYATWTRAELLATKRDAQRVIEHYVRIGHTPTGPEREKMLIALRMIREITKHLAKRRSVLAPKGGR